MRLLQLLPAAAVLGNAFVIPDEAVMQELSVESHAQKTGSSWSDLLEETVNDVKNPLDKAFSSISEKSKTVFDNVEAAAFGAESWISSASVRAEEYFSLFGGGEHPPHHDHPHPPHHGGPHHPGHEHKPNKTIYELISESKYTTKLAKLVDEDKDLVKILNSTVSNFTLFAPTDHAFEKIPEHAPKPSKELIKKVLLYHISPEFYPAGRVLATHTIPTLFNETHLADKPVPQRLAVNLGLKGLTVNFYSRVVAVNIFATNGVIHGVDSIIIPPPKTIEIISFFPAEFSTLTLGLTKTGLLEALNTTAHAGGTFFAPSNFAFRKLGPKINGFLFSKYGEKYLKALLEYHVVANQTLYSDVYYKPNGDIYKLPPKGLFHVDLPTLLDNHSLSVDIGKYGPFIEFKINGFSRVSVFDGVAKDGVIQVVSDVLVPPKQLQGEMIAWEGEELTEEDLMERLEPFVNKRIDL